MRRLLVPATIAAILTWAFAGPALAGTPQIEPLDLPPAIELPAGEACDFAIVVDFLANNGKTTTFFDRNGNPVRAIGTGTLKIRVANAEDDQAPSIMLNISGPVHSWFHADGSTTTVYGGRSVSLYPAGTFVLTAGRAVVQLDATGAFVSVTNIGFELDICEAVAG